MNKSISKPLGARLRRSSLILAVLMLAALMPVSALAARGGDGMIPPAESGKAVHADGEPASREGSGDASAPPVDGDFSRIRVLISTNEGSYVNLDLGTYYTLSDGRKIGGTLDAPQKIKAAVSGGGVKLTDRTTGDVIMTGDSIFLSRVTERYEAGYATLSYSANSDTNGRMYLGSFRFMADEGKIVMINDVPMVYYLYGVVGYELNTESYPEALMAQAVTSKNHALYYVKTSDEYYFDVKDGWEVRLYQAYRGFRTNRLPTMYACFAVIGEAMAYNGQFFSASYGHSNGGETALPSHFYGSTNSDGPYAVMLDDIEFEYDDETSIRIHVDYGTPGESSALRDFILGKINDAFGVDAVSVVSISEILAFDPVEGTQRNMQSLRIRAKVTLDSKGGGRANQTFTIECPITELHTYRLTDIDGSGDDYSSDKYVYNNNYLLYWGYPTSGGYTLVQGRYGHGIGLSQIGALARANPDTYGQDHRDILRFYFPNCELITIREDDPTANEDPLPPLDPIIAYGEICVNGAEMRQGYSESAYPVMGHAMAGEHVDVLEAYWDEWYKVCWRGWICYVKVESVSITSFTSPENGVFTLTDGSNPSAANLRSQPWSGDNVIIKLPKNTQMTRWAQIGKWCFVTTSNGYTGFISKNVVNFGDPYEYTGVASLSVRDWWSVQRPRPAKPVTGSAFSPAE
jgi:SpoIID/LytB domain protein